MLAVSGSPAASIVAKATVTTALGLTGAWLARRSRAAVRHALLAATFAVLLALPIASIFAPAVRIAVPAAAEERAAPTLAGTTGAIPPAAPAQTSGGVTSAAPRPAGLSPSVLLLTGWAAGTALFLLPVVMGLWQVRSLRRSGLPWRQGQAVAERLAPGAGIHRRVAVLLHGALPGPMTCGAVHPAIMLSQEAETWDGEDLNRAIVHELEHVRRGDWVSHCLARAVCAVYWFHPLVWIAWRRLALEAERSCDDAVLGRSEATAYADQLVRLAQRLSLAAKVPAAKSPVPAMANRADLAARVRAVLDNRRRRGRAGALAVALACAAAAALVLTVSPLRMVAAPQSARPDAGVASTPQFSADATPATAAASVSDSGKGSEGTRATDSAVSEEGKGAAPQSPSTEAKAAPVPQFSADTMLVIANVSVSGANGESIEGLGVHDFAVTEDGVAQTIVVFEFQKLDTVAQGPGSYYTLGYYTSNQNRDGNYRQIKIACQGDPAAKLDYRAGYYTMKLVFVGNGGAAQSADPGITPPVLRYKKLPEYSEEARKAKYQGTVVLNVEVDASGQATNVNVVRHLGLGLDEKAVEAVGQWRFQPGMKDGKAVTMQAQVEVNFRLL